MKKNRCRICDQKLINGFCPDCGIPDHYTAASDNNRIDPIPKKKIAIIWSAICVFLILLPRLLYTQPFQSLISIVQQQQVLTSIPDSIYENAPRQLSVNGSLAEMTLDEGNYIVGIDIAEGTYQINVVGRIASIDVEDEANQIDFFYWLQEDSDFKSSYLQDVRLYQGAIMRIEKGKIMFSSSNAQTGSLLELPPNNELNSYRVEDGAVSGADFPEGTYDITLAGGEYGSVRVTHPDRNEDALGFYDIMGTSDGVLSKFRNVEFPKGTMLEISEVEIILIPSVRNSLNR